VRKIETQPPRAPDVHAGQSQLQNHAAAGTAGCQVGASSAQLSAASSAKRAAASSGLAQALHGQLLLLHQLLAGGLHLGGGGLVDGQALQASGRQGKRRAMRVVHKCSSMDASMHVPVCAWLDVSSPVHDAQAAGRCATYQLPPRLPHPHPSPPSRPTHHPPTAPARCSTCRPCR
jgi:hypothetical protein